MMSVWVAGRPAPFEAVTLTLYVPGLAVRETAPSIPVRPLAGAGAPVAEMVKLARCPRRTDQRDRELNLAGCEASTRIEPGRSSPPMALNMSSRSGFRGCTRVGVP